MNTEYRLELADFLRKKRARLSPEEVGLPTGRRRRVAGLRREEVAELANMSTTWYTWLEQGREISHSLESLERLAVALRLDSSETGYLLKLSGHRPAEESEKSFLLDESVSLTLRQLQPYPAYVVATNWDVLAWNQAANCLLGPFEELECGERNLLWLAFTKDAYKTLFKEWERFARCTLNHYRADAHLSPGNPGLLQRLQERSPHFREWWPNHDVSKPANWRKEIRHPTLGDLSFDPCNLNLVDYPNASLVVLTPSDQSTSEAIDVLPFLPASLR